VRRTNICRKSSNLCGDQEFRTGNKVYLSCVKLQRRFLEHSHSGYPLLFSPTIPSFPSS